MKREYHPGSIEKKWQAYWEENKTYEVKEDYSKPKYYVLDMFPYPSGAGLHVGHVVGYTGSDVISRYKRQKGFNVLHPMGWDSFGLPAEQYAIRTGTHPKITTEQNIDTYRRQLKSLGLSYDWSREFATSDPDYYRWTQWIFTKLYEKGLAYETEAMVNYCPSLGTVLSNEEVENGKSVDGGYPIERRPLRQWMLKITAYAERLLEDLDMLDWPDHLKKLQRNWIGKSEGANIDFVIDGMDEKITCFTTRADTIFGLSYVVIAPEHPILSKVTTINQKEMVDAYAKEVLAKSDLERTDLAKTKSGVFTGSYVINPITKEKVPLWVADYVLMSYGTGAVMAVAAHDERDKEFSEIYNLPKKVVMDAEGRYIHSKNEIVDLSQENLDSAKEKVSIALEKMGLGERKVNYKLRDWLFSRQRYWGEPFPILHFEDGTKRILDLDELPLTPPSIEDYKPTGDGKSPLAKVSSWVEIVDPKTGKKAFRETNIMPQWAGSCWYYLRFCDPKNKDKAWSKEKEAYWMPVDLYIGGVEHAVLHLLYARFWHKVLYDVGAVTTKEPFMCLRNQGLVISKAYKLEAGGYVAEVDLPKHSDEKVIELIEKMSKSKMNGVSPDEMIEEYGADALRLYELFMAPFDKEKLWQTDAVTGCKRFLNRIYDLVNSEKNIEEDTKAANRLIHKLIKQVEDDYQVLGFNTAIAKMMEFLNNFTALDQYPRGALKKFIQILYPFAPHFGEECWEILGGKNSIVYEPFPVFDASFLVEDEVTIVFQVNGKLRGKSVFPKGVNEDEVLDFAKNDPNVKNFLKAEVSKVIFVPDKLLNLVTL
jgi:leucyl-tRNA synthetase